MIRVGRSRVSFVNPEPPKPSFNKTLYLNSTPGHESGDQFYTGFSDDIEQGGIFVATYDLKPIGTKATVRISLPELGPFGISGKVQWIREYNNETPDISPGMGVSFCFVDKNKKAAIESYLKDNQALFYDNTQIPASQPEVMPKATPDVSKYEKVQKTLALASTALANPCVVGSEPIDPEPFVDDNASAHKFVMGICRDVEHYVDDDKKPKPIERVKNTKLLKTLQVNGLDEQPPAHLPLIQAVVVPQVSTQFQGGFSEGDRGRGVFISSQDPKPKGTELAFRIDLGGYTITASGRVEWLRRVNAGYQSATAPAGMGVRLSKLSRHAENQIAAVTPRGSGFVNCAEI